MKTEVDVITASNNRLVFAGGMTEVQILQELQTVRQHFNIYASSSAALAYDAEVRPQTRYTLRHNAVYIKRFDLG